MFLFLKLWTPLSEGCPASRQLPGGGFKVMGERLNYYVIGFPRKILIERSMPVNNGYGLHLEIFTASV